MRTIIVLLLALSPSLAEACYRCGNYKSCRYYAKAAYVKPVVAQTSVFVVQNNAPPTIGQGNTIYRSTGFQASAFPYFDRNAYLAGVNEVHRGFVSGLSQSMTRADTLAQTFAGTDAPIAQVTATANAYEQTLTALGLNLNAAPNARNNAVVINRDAAGRVQIFRLDEQQIANVNGYMHGQANGANGSGAQYQAAQQSQYPMLTLFCAKCHSPDLPTPQGRYANADPVYIGNHVTVADSMRKQFFTIVDAVSSGKMPPKGEQQPSPEQKAAIFNEIQGIVKQHAGGNGAPPYTPQYQRAPSNEPPPAPLPDQPLPQQGN